MTEDLFRECHWYEAGERHNAWPELRTRFLNHNSRCVCCGSRTALNVHHIKPFHLFPELELVPDNLITLCEGGPINCHFIIGHGGKNWRTYIPEDKLQLAILAMQQGIKFLQGLTST